MSAGGGDLLVQLLGAAAVSAVLGAIVNGIINRRKLGAEATQIISDAAASTVKNVQSDNASLREELRGVRTELDEMKEAMRHREAEWRQERESQQAVLQVHAAYDSLMVQRLRECSTGSHLALTDIGDPPPLYPPAILRADLTL